MSVERRIRGLGGLRRPDIGLARNQHHMPRRPVRGWSSDAGATCGRRDANTAGPIDFPRAADREDAFREQPPCATGRRADTRVRPCGILQGHGRRRPLVARAGGPRRPRAPQPGERRVRLREDAARRLRRHALRRAAPGARADRRVGHQAGRHPRGPQRDWAARERPPPPQPRSGDPRRPAGRGGHPLRRSSGGNRAVPGVWRGARCGAAGGPCARGPRPWSARGPPRPQDTPCAGRAAARRAARAQRGRDRCRSPPWS